MIALNPGAPPKPRKRAKRRGHADPVSHDLWMEVVAADGLACAAPLVCDCIASGSCEGLLTLNHVKDQPMMGKRAPSDRHHLISLCESHHLWSGWEAAHHAEQRAYIARRESR